jgi:peptide/nickel transport system substrate-binding protein
MRSARIIIERRRNLTGCFVGELVNKLLARFSSYLIATLLVLPSGAHADKTLKVAMHSDLKIVDPIWTTALISTHHGYMIYDTLFAVDEKLMVQPQMVEKHQLSADQLTWTPTLRDGLEWHDGQPVTSEDCIASIKRWGTRDTMGQKLMLFVAEFAAPDARTIKIRLREPYGLVLASLAKPGSNGPFVMPKRVAETDPLKQVEDYTGSGPFIFKKDERRPGERAIYVRNSKYTLGNAGGKAAQVDRVEWIWIADPQTQVNALLSGEIDMIEAPAHDLLPLLARDRNIELVNNIPQGRQYAFRFNTLHKPFDNPKIRHAAAHAFAQQDFLEGTIGDAEWYLESVMGWEDKLGANVEKAGLLLQEAEYDGTPVVLMQSSDIAALSNMTPDAKAQLERVGFKVDLQAMDWQTLVARRAKKEAPSAGGWSAFITSWSSLDILDPVAAAFLNASCDKATFGWPCDLSSRDCAMPSRYVPPRRRPTFIWGSTCSPLLYATV